MQVPATAEGGEPTIAQRRAPCAGAGGSALAGGHRGQPRRVAQGHRWEFRFAPGRRAVAGGRRGQVSWRRPRAAGAAGISIAPTPPPPSGTGSCNRPGAALDLLWEVGDRGARFLTAPLPASWRGCACTNPKMAATVHCPMRRFHGLPCHGVTVVTHASPRTRPESAPFASSLPLRGPSECVLRSAAPQLLRPPPTLSPRSFVRIL